MVRFPPAPFCTGTPSAIVLDVVQQVEAVGVSRRVKSLAEVKEIT